MNTGHPNPYIGPRTFLKEEGHLFFGRDDEAADLEALVASEKLVLFYAQSGAGKSSLLNARLIPSLEEKLFEVLPVARLSGDAPGEVMVENIYIYNLIRSLLGRETDHQLLCTLTLSQFLEKLNEDENGYFYDQGLTASMRSTFEPAPWPRALVIDQFEEIFSINVEAWQKREDFFSQLAQAMQDDPYLWVILVMREDFIAALDPYAHLLPGGLRVRYYMERLSYEAAIQAIRSPVEALRPYAEGVAEKLAEDLSSVRVQKPDGTTGIEPGQYIEPVQLQVVCHGLWENLPPEGTEITQKDLQDVGDVNQSLGRYYDRRVSEVARTKHLRERLIREWFGQKLITAGGIRNMVLQERETRPGEVDDHVIRALQSDLVRAEKRGGATWYELTHDRLVEPILASNKKWFEENLSPLQSQAAFWKEQGKNETWLLSEKALIEVEQWAKDHPDELTEVEMEFLKACQVKQKEIGHLQELESQQRKLVEERKLGRQRRIITYITITATMLMGILTVISLIQFNSAQRAAVLARASRSIARAAEAAALVQQAKAVSIASTAQADAEEAKKQRGLARNRELSAQAVALRENKFLLSLLLGIEANMIASTVQSQAMLLDNVQARPELHAYLNGHTDWVFSVAFSPDGKTLASGSWDKTIILWDVTTGQPIGQPLTGHADYVSSVAFSPDGKTLASGSWDKTIILWDVTTGQPIGQPLTGHTDSVYSVAFSPDGKTLASGSGDQTILLWDVATGQPIGQPLTGHADYVSSVAFSPDGKTLASGSGNKTILLWDVTTGQPIGQPLTGHTNSVSSVAFSPDGKTLASGSADKTIILWDVTTGQPIGQPLTRHTDYVYSVAFSPDGKTLASGSADKTILLWDVATGQPIGQPLTGHTDYLFSVAFSPDGKTLASGSADQTIILWDVAAGQPIGQPLTGHTGPVSSVAFSPDGKTLASGSADQTIILWDVTTGQPIGQPLTGHTIFVSSVAFSPDGKTLASGSADQTIILWDVTTGQPIGQPLTGHTGPVFSVAFSPDGKTLASGSADKTIILWDVTTGQPIGQPLTGHTDSVYSVAFSPDGKTLASGSGNKTILLWDVTTGQPIGQPLTGHTDLVFSVAFSPDGKTLASGSGDQTIILWDVATGQPLGQSLTGHTNSVSSVAFSPDGKTLASGSWDKTIILWDVATGQPIGQPLTGHTDYVNSVAFSPDGKTLASGSADKTIILWDLDAQSWIEKSCRRANRNFTFTEWQQYFPGEAYRKTCAQFPLEPEATPTATP